MFYVFLCKIILDLVLVYSVADLEGAEPAPLGQRTDAVTVVTVLLNPDK